MLRSAIRLVALAGAAILINAAARALGGKDHEPGAAQTSQGILERREMPSAASTSKWRDPIGCFTGILALATLLLAVITFLQFAAFVQSERAYLSVGGIRKTSVGTTSPLELQLEIKNSGKSTAMGTLSTSYGLVALPNKPDYSGGFVSPIVPVVASGSVSHSLTVGFPSPYYIDKIMAGTTPLFVFGFLKYRDEYSYFGSKKIGFCFMYNPRSDPSISIFDLCKNVRYTYAR